MFNLQNNKTNRHPELSEGMTEIMTHKVHQVPHFALSCIVLLSTFASISLGLLVFHWNIDGLLLILIFALCLVTWKLGYSFNEIIKMIIGEVVNSLPALFILMFVSITIGCWILSGTIPTMISLGLEYLEPESLLLTTFIISSLTSVILGSSWGTIGTIGLVVISLAQASGVSVAMTAGAVISGACFGDKISPLSDTTNLASLASNVSLSQHIRSMLLTTIPAYIIVFLIFLSWGDYAVHEVVPASNIASLQEELQSEFLISPITFLPVLVLIVLGCMRKGALVILAAGICTSGIIAFFLQGVRFTEFLQVIDYGYQSVGEHSDIFLQIVNRGGVMSMMSIFVFTMLVISVGGLLNHVGFLRVVVQYFVEKIQRPAGVVASTIVTTMVCAMATGDSYMPIILTGKLFQDIYNKMGIHRSVLSRCCEDGATLFVPIIPWSATAIYFSGALGVATIEYLPYAIFCWLNPIVSIFMSFCTIGLISCNEDGSQRFFFKIIGNKIYVS